MSGFGQTLFGGSSFIRWTLSPAVLLFAVLMPALVEKWTPLGAALMGGAELMCLSLLAGFWLPSRFGRWAFRALAGFVFLAYLAYLVYELQFSDAPITIAGGRGEATPVNALKGFVFIGLPSLWYACFGRFSLSKKAPRGQLGDE